MTSPAVESIARAMGDTRRTLVDHIEVFDSIDSTNTYLMQASAPERGRFRVAVAVQQTSGRGRRGRQWLSPPGAGLYLSLAWSCSTPLDQLSGATLVIGACVASALDKIGVAGIQLKWPNDIMLNDGKLGGILTESRIARSGQTVIVTGIGINRDLSEVPQDDSEWSNLVFSDLASYMDATPDTNRLAGAIAGAVIEGLVDMADGNAGPYLEQWKIRDWLKGQMVVVDDEANSLRGVCRGVDASGALLLESGGECRRLVAGSVRRLPSGDCSP